ncbi:baseplate assembly protein [Pseudomonas sp. v388]|uniref:baseplate J/gp47 family protein n=1 Tax=Pseudomonas sp. v388 TaxID=2479849 RepID=UPI000F7A1F14|nr:baseplate J/gp47 family protein [Pseudomonas sp. v388]RRV04436.1 baseplate assembly protein [Pseudomonas sp. v388]
MSTFAPIDLGQLPAPQVVEQLDYEQILSQRKAYAISLWPVDEQAEIRARLDLESEPLSKLLQENAYRELVWRQRVNEAALANLLSSAKRSDLEQLAANFNVKRLIIKEANPTASPPQQRIMEGDDSLRERAQMAWEGLSTAGPRNSYIFHARAADGRVADATAESPSPASVVVTIQGAQGEGAAEPDLLHSVSAYLNHENRRPVADRLTIQSAEVIRYKIHAQIFLTSDGPESEPILAVAKARLLALVNRRRRLGMEVTSSILHSALHVEGVRKVVLVDWQDVRASAYQAPYCTSVVLLRSTD